MGSWPWPPPAMTTHAVHPHHHLVLLRYNRNYCDLCGGPLVGMLGYRCEPCNFDVHCTCLLTSTGTRSTLPPPPPHNAQPPPPPPPPAARPSYCYYPPAGVGVGPGAHAQHHRYAAGQPSVIYATPPPATAGRPQLKLSLSEQFSHQPAAQTSVSPAPSNHGYYHHHRPRPDYGAPYPQSYDHLQQQNYPTMNNQQQGGYDVPVPDQQSFDYLQQQNCPIAYQHDYTETRDSGDADDYNYPDDMDDY